MEYPELVDLQHEFAGAPNFRLISVSCGGYPGQSLDDIRQQTSNTMIRTGSRFPTYTDVDGFVMQSVAETLEQEGLMFPTSILVNEGGTVHAVWQGYHPNGVNEMRSIIDSLAVK